LENDGVSKDSSSQILEAKSKTQTKTLNISENTFCNSMR